MGGFGVSKLCIFPVGRLLNGCMYFDRMDEGKGLSSTYIGAHIRLRLLSGLGERFQEHKYLLREHAR